MKAIKFLFVAIVLIAAIIILSMDFPKSEAVAEPEFTSEQANEWKEKINQLCKDNNWSVSGYEKIEIGIHTDNVMSDGELVSSDEERTLLKYLFAMSCSSQFENADTHFKLESYSDKNIKMLDSAKVLLNGKTDKFGENSNLTNLSKLMYEYHSLMGMIYFSSKATYSKPFKEFSAPSADVLKGRIAGLKHYKTHFSKNSSINAKVKNIAYERNRAEQLYYENLESLIEKNYTGNLIDILDDQIRFNEISTNSSAKQKLDLFIQNNPT